MSRISEKTKEKRGLGAGEGADYKSYITAAEFNSQGTAVTLRDWKTGRSVELLSQGEAEYWHILRFDDDIVDIREQFPLDKAKTDAVAAELGFNPVNGGRTRMTTDFVILYKDGHVEAHSYKKTEKNIMKKRALEKVKIEKEYWERQGATFVLVIGTEVNRTLSSNIRVCSYHYDHNDVYDFASYIKHLIIHKKLSIDLEQEKIDIPTLKKDCFKEVQEWNGTIPTTFYVCKEDSSLVWPPRLGTENLLE